MDDEIDFLDLGDYSKTWVSYFDLLGFTNKVKPGDYFEAVDPYAKAIKEFKEDYGFGRFVEKVWFSDTFVLYSSDDSNDSFVSVERLSRAFISSLVCRGIPVRGAMSYGNFYGNKKYNVFFGPAFIEAYDYGEHQDWIGFVLTPSATNRMATAGLPLYVTCYSYWDVPFKSCEQKTSTYLPAYIIGKELTTNGNNRALDELRKLSLQYSNSKFVHKYQNAIRFIEANQKKSGSG